ncbi:MAG TPA: hypothetical protein VGP64_01220 [Polyangia bacterium]
MGDPDNNAWKTVGASIALTLNPMVSLIGTTYIGKEATQVPGAGGSTPGDTTILVDVVGAFTLNSQFGLNLNFDYVKAPPATSVADDHQLGWGSTWARTLSSARKFVATSRVTRSSVSIPRRWPRRRRTSLPARWPRSPGSNRRITS